MKTNRIGSICARGGSKGLKNKNIRNFEGKPLIAHVIEIALNAQIFDALAVSSDCSEILKIADEWGVKYLIERPKEMATDIAPKLPAIQHCVAKVQKISGIQFSTMVDLSVTSPLMLPEDIINAIALLESSDAINVISAAPTAHSPYFSVVEKRENGFVQLVTNNAKTFNRRQDCPPCYDLNGAIYVWNSKHFFEVESVITNRTLISEMPPERSIDIDSEIDFEFANFLYKKRMNNFLKHEITQMV